MTHTDVWNAIDTFANAHNISCSKLAKMGGLDPTTFNKSKRWSKYGQPRWPSTSSIAKIRNRSSPWFLFDSILDPIFLFFN